MRIHFAKLESNESCDVSTGEYFHTSSHPHPRRGGGGVLLHYVPRSAPEPLSVSQCVTLPFPSLSLPPAAAGPGQKFQPQGPPGRLSTFL